MFEESIAISCGAFRWAAVAVPPSPEYPDVPLPAKGAMTFVVEVSLNTRCDISHIYIFPEESTEHASGFRKSATSASTPVETILVAPVMLP